MNTMKYDKRKIMQMAHRTYASAMYRCGRTFGQCLKEAWEIAKSERKFLEEREARVKVMLANRKPVAEVKLNEKEIRWEDCYNANSRGHLGAQYCGD